MHRDESRSGRVELIMISAAIALATLVGCTATPGPEPAPTPAPVFTSEAEAFAAADQVYRAYNDALNAKRSGDAEADPTLFLTGLALESEIDAAQYLDQRELRLVGDGVVISVSGVSADLESGSIEVGVCLDVSGTNVMSKGGTDETPSDRLERVPLAVAFVRSEHALQIASSNLIKGELC